MKITKNTTASIKEIQSANQVTTKRHSLLNAIENTLIENEINELDFKTLEAVVSFHNFDNYFKNDVSNIETFEDLIDFINDDANILEPKSSKMNVRESKRAWLKRANAYIKSHVIGTVDSAALNNNTKRYKFTAKEKGNVIHFTLNETSDNLIPLVEVETKKK